MFELIKPVFIGLLCFSKSLPSIVNTPDDIECISFNNQQCITQPNLINLHPNEYIEGFRYYPFAVNLDRSIGSCNILSDLSNKLCVPNQTEDLSLSVFNMIAGINESKILTKHISCECKCKFDGRKCSSNQKWNYHKCLCECKNPKEHIEYEKDYIMNRTTCSCENVDYLASTIDDSVIMCDEIKNAVDCVSTNVTYITNTIRSNVMKTVSINSNDEKVRYKIDCYILHTVLLVILLLLIIAIICYHYTKQKLIGALAI